MAKLTRLSQDDRENLAAYLDGELDENGTRRIESLLTVSEVARNDVDVLARTYDMLELLPRPKVTADFTERTLVTARQKEHRQPITEQAWFRAAQRGALLAGWGIVILATATAGYLLSNRAIPREEDLLLQQLPVIQNMDVYLETGNIEFLRDLAAQKPLLEELERSHPR